MIAWFADVIPHLLFFTSHLIQRETLLQFRAQRTTSEIAKSQTANDAAMAGAKRAVPDFAAYRASVHVAQRLAFLRAAFGIDARAKPWANGRCRNVLFVGRDVAGTEPDEEVLAFTEHLLWGARGLASGSDDDDDGDDSNSESDGGSGTAAAAAEAPHSDCGSDAASCVASVSSGPTPPFRSSGRNVLVTDTFALEDALGALAASGCSAVRLVALGHYLAAAEAWGMYGFVAGTDDDASFFSCVLSRCVSVTSFWALGCVTARARPFAEWRDAVANTSFCDAAGAVTWLDCLGTAAEDATLVIDGPVTSVLAADSLIATIAAGIDAGTRGAHPLRLSAEMQFTVPVLQDPATGALRFVPIVLGDALGAVQSPRSAPYANAGKFAWLRDAFAARVDKLGPKPLRVAWTWTPEAPLGRPLPPAVAALPAAVRFAARRAALAAVRSPDPHGAVTALRKEMTASGIGVDTATVAASLHSCPNVDAAAFCACVEFCLECNYVATCSAPHGVWW